MLENWKNRVYEYFYSHIRLIVNQAVEEGAEHGVRDAMRKFGIAEEPTSAKGNGQRTVVVIPAKPDGPPKLPLQDPPQPAAQLQARKRGRPRKVITYDDPNKS